MVEKCDIGTATLAYRIFGSGKIDCVIEGSLNSCNAEWWDLCLALHGHTILVYDRGGYGQSSPSTLPRSPKNIVSELHALLQKLPVRESFLLVGHSQGGLYATLFALCHPERVKGLILLDPLSYSDNSFKSKLSPSEYKQSGVDKSQALSLGKFLTGLRLGFLFKGLLKKAPPFYYHSFSPEAEQYILKALTQHKQYVTALAEYELSHKAENLKVFIEGTLQCPVTLITHSTEIMVKEIEYFGNTSHETAVKIETVWQDIMEDMKNLAGSGKKVIASNSGHYIHLTDTELLIKEITAFL